MESNIKGLVSAGHEMASELKAECGAVDMRSVAKLISDLATQLEVQLVRANALAAENARLKVTCEDRRRFIMKGVQLGYIKVPKAETDPDLETIRIAISPQKPTPATDAFLAEVRAQGVEMFAECAYTLEHHDHAVAFAAELRKGGNQ
ncbi:eae-like domain protein [Escherichia marmotae]